MGGASEEVVEKFGLAGEKIGVAFQILDDILDVTSTMEELGKPIRSDEKNKKTTYVTCMALKNPERSPQYFPMKLWQFGKNWANPVISYRH